MTREYVTIPKEAWDFLCGQGELDGVSFGEPHPTRFGLYWWRSYIAALTAPAPAPDDEALIAVCDRLARAAMTTGGTAGPDPELIAAHEAYSARRGALAAILENQIPTPPEGMHYELVPDGETLSEITDEWGQTTKQMLLHKCEAVSATKRAIQLDEAVREALDVTPPGTSAHRILMAALKTKEPTNG